MTARLRHIPAHQRRTSTPPALPLVCPSCGGEAVTAEDKTELRDELRTVWWTLDPETGTVITSKQYCHQPYCRPADVHVAACGRCHDGPLLAGELAVLARAAAPELPPQVTDLLGDHWHREDNVRGKGPAWVCC